MEETNNDLVELSGDELVSQALVVEILEGIDTEVEDTQMMWVGGVSYLDRGKIKMVVYQ